MAKLNITIEVPGVFDPTLTDPHEVADQIVDTYNEWVDAQHLDPVEYSYAEWADEEEG